MDKRTCKIDGCDRPHAARGWCHTHWHRWHKHGDPGPARLLKTHKGDTPYERLCALGWIVDDETGCWLWTGRNVHEFGYGQFTFKGKLYRAHRVALEHAVGPINGLMALHSCDTPACVNPAHLRAGTGKDNSDDMHDRGRGVHPGLIDNRCKKNLHDVVGENAGINSKGNRYCVACHKEALRAWYRRAVADGRRGR